jgi:hypothetical protein
MHDQFAAEHANSPVNLVEAHVAIAVAVFENGAGNQLRGRIPDIVEQRHRIRHGYGILRKITLALGPQPLAAESPLQARQIRGRHGQRKPGPGIPANLQPFNRSGRLDFGGRGGHDGFRRRLLNGRSRRRALGPESPRRHEPKACQHPHHQGAPRRARLCHVHG